jgi:hypothetical protein
LQIHRKLIKATGKYKFNLNFSLNTCSGTLTFSEASLWRFLIEEALTMMELRLYYISFYLQSHRFHTKHVLIYLYIGEKKGKDNKIGTKCNMIH